MINMFCVVGATQSAAKQRKRVCNPNREGGQSLIALQRKEVLTLMLIFRVWLSRDDQMQLRLFVKKVQRLCRGCRGKRRKRLRRGRSSSLSTTTELGEAELYPISIATLWQFRYR
jgi:hypothetical protein